MVQARSLVFRDEDTPLDELVAQLSGMQVSVDAEEVEVRRAATSVAGEVWSPQLLPYEDWSKHKDIETQVLRVEGQDPAYDEGLLAWGRLDFIDDDLREELLAQVRERGDAEAYAAAVVKRRTFAADDDLRGAVVVRQDTDGYVLVGFDLRRYAQAIGASDNLVVVLPAAVDGVPIVRIAQEAFVRRLVQGVDVRLLVIPDTVRRLGGYALSALSCRHIHLGASLESGGDQSCHMVSVHPWLVSRTYTVNPRNRFYRADGGSLYTADGKTLLLLAPPYAKRLRLPDGIERVASTAFCEGCDAPSFVEAPATLQKVRSKVFDDAVWLCSPDSPLRDALATRGVRLASENVVERDGCWYDFDEEGAVLVAGPPAPKSASSRFAETALNFGKRGSYWLTRSGGGVNGSGADAGDLGDGANGSRGGLDAGATFASPAGTQGVSDAHEEPVRTELVLPLEVEGRPLVRIGPRALPHAPETVVVPGSVRVVGRENACLGTKRLSLAEGVRRIGAHSFRSRVLEPPVLIPKSVESIGEGCFEYAVCHMAHNGAVVHVPADQLLSCFVERPVRAGGAGGAGASGGADAGDREPARRGDIHVAPPAAGEPSADGDAGSVGASAAAPFDFARYDQVLLGGKNIPDRLGATLHRLACPVGLSDATRTALVAYARGAGREALERVAREGDAAMVAALLDVGFICDENFDAQIELLRACNRTDCVMYLMERRQEERDAAAPKSLRERFAL